MEDLGLKHLDAVGRHRFEKAEGMVYVGIEECADFGHEYRRMAFAYWHWTQHDGGG
jgi:hypothetical protein